MIGTPRLFINCRACTLSAEDYGLIDDAAILVEHGKISWIGARNDAPYQSHHSIDLQGALVIPGLIDCHTHIVYAGNRANEFEQRLNGASYADIARSGGGILSTVNATRKATTAQLFEEANARLAHFMDEGVTTLEIKSGYGLDTDSELKMLRVAQMLADNNAINIRKTFLGAHALPPEYAGRADDYIDYLCEELLPQAQTLGLVDAVDVFCENIGFSLPQAQKMLRTARSMDLAVKIHAEQLSDQKAACMAAELGALSVDHIEYLAEEDVAILAQHRCVAVLLPGAYYYLRETRQPPLSALRLHNVPMAIASDSNPGSSPTSSLLLMMNMACTLFRMTPLEVLFGVTRHAAQALGLQASKGQLRAGMDADFAVFAISHPAELCYRFGDNPNTGRVVNGVWFPRTHSGSGNQTA